MRRPASCQPSRLRPFLLLVLLAVIACGDQPTQVQVDGVSLAKGGGGGGGGGPKVRSTDPASAPQETTLDVRVLGSGFESDAVVTFLLNGNPTVRVSTNSTQFMSSSELVANITIAVDALVDLYDVEVFLAGRGRRGIGGDLFSVLEKGGGNPWAPTSGTLSIRDRDDPDDPDDPDRVTSDTGADYVDGEGKVVVEFDGMHRFNFAPATNPKGKRFVRLDFGDEVEEGPPPFTTVDLDQTAGFRTVQKSLLDMTCPSSMMVAAKFMWQEKGNSPLYHLHFGLDGRGEGPTGDPIEVTRASSDGGASSTWTLAPSGEANARLYEGNVPKGTYRMPFQFKVVGPPCPGT